MKRRVRRAKITLSRNYTIARQSCDAEFCWCRSLCRSRSSRVLPAFCRSGRHPIQPFARTRMYLSRDRRQQRCGRRVGPRAPATTRAHTHTCRSRCFPRSPTETRSSEQMGRRRQENRRPGDWEWLHKRNLPGLCTFSGSNSPAEPKLPDMVPCPPSPTSGMVFVAPAPPGVAPPGKSKYLLTPGVTASAPVPPSSLSPPGVGGPVPLCDPRALSLS